MNSNFPVPITSVTDLEFYENYLKEEFPHKTDTDINLHKHLKTLVGNIVKIDCSVGNRLESKIGKLIQVGEDFLTLNLQNGRNLSVCLSNIKFVTVLQRNTKNPHF